MAAVNTSQLFEFSSGSGERDELGVGWLESCRVCYVPLSGYHDKLSNDVLPFFKVDTENVSQPTAAYARAERTQSNIICGVIWSRVSGI